MPRDHVFIGRRPRLMRRHIPRSESYSVLAVLTVLVAVVAWVTTTRNDFDPNDRDLPAELQHDRSAVIEIYNRPLKLWMEPGQAVQGGIIDLRPFPEATLDAEWQPVGRVRRFQPDNLYEKINGEAEKFIKQGFVELAYLLLRSGDDGAEIAIELFDQGDLGGSLGVFAEHSAGRDVQERDGVSYFMTGAGVIGRKDNYFFRVAGDRQGERIAAKSASLVEAFGSLGASTEAPEPQPLPPGFTLLKDRLGIAEADIQYQESNVFKFDFAERFWFGGIGTGDARVFVHIAEDTGRAESLVDALLEEQRYEYDEVPGNHAHTLLRHRFLNTYFVVVRKGRYVYGMEKLEDPAAVPVWLGRITENLTDDEA